MFYIEANVWLWTGLGAVISPYLWCRSHSGLWARFQHNVSLAVRKRVLTIQNGLITGEFSWFSQLGMHRVSAGTKSVYNTFQYLVTVFVDFSLIFNYSFLQGSSAHMQLGQIGGGLYWNLCSSGSSGRGRGGPRNVTSMGPPSATIFFMTSFYMAGGGGTWPHRPPPRIRYCCDHKKCTSE